MTLGPPGLPPSHTSQSWVNLFTDCSQWELQKHFPVPTRPRVRTRRPSCMRLSAPTPRFDQNDVHSLT